MNLKSKLVYLTTLLLLAVSATKTVKPSLATNQVNQQTTASESGNIITDDPEVKANIQERIQQAVSKNQGSTTTESLIAFLGTVESVTDQSITILVDSQSELISINQTTRITDQDQTELSIEDLPIDSALVAVVSQDELGLYQASQIVSLEEAPETPNKISLIGSVSQIDTRADTIELLTLPTYEPLQVEFAQSTSLYQGIDDGLEINVEDLAIGDEILAIYQEAEDDEVNSLVRLQLLSRAATDSANTLETELDTDPTN